jgi:hypothetical protein
MQIDLSQPEQVEVVDDPGTKESKAPTKEEVLELFREVTSTKQKLRIDDAIR